MKCVALASVVALAATLSYAPAANASGFIVVDPVAGRPPVVVRPPVTRPGHRPGTVVPAPGGRPVLQGSISYGLHLKDESVKVEISDQVAKTFISQTFSNDSDQNLAGTYLFPLPDDTTFSSFSLLIDGKPVEGKILEATAARTEYESIVRRMVDPGLLEYADYKTVRARIFPIPAHGTKKVELEYTQILRAENGMLKYRFPLKAKGGDEPIDEMKIDVKLASKQPIRTIWSPTHAVTSSRNGENDAKVSFLEKESLPDKDFLLYYSVSDKDLAANLLTHRKTDEDGYFLMTLAPPLGAKTVAGKDIVIVADTSGSMQGDKMEQNRKALKYMVNGLSSEDRFSVVQFNTDTEAFRTRLVPATADNKKEADKFISELEPHGGTNISDALAMATTILNEESTRPAYIVLITDGEPTVGETDISKLLGGVKSKRDLRIFDFGVGYDVNTRLLNKLAEQHHGTAQYVEPDESLETALSSFCQKISKPVLSDVKLAFEGIQVKDVYPKEVKDIFAGSQVILIGRYKGDGAATVKLTGELNGIKKAYSFPLTFKADEAGHSYLPRLWAMRRIGYLTEVAQANGDNKEVVDEIIALSQKYGIISQYTSYLVTDPSEGGRIDRFAARGGGMVSGRAWPVSRAASPALAGRARSIGGLPPSSTDSASGMRFHYLPSHRMESGMVPPPPAVALSPPVGFRGDGGAGHVADARAMDLSIPQAWGGDIFVSGTPSSSAASVRGKLPGSNFYAARRKMAVVDDRPVVYGDEGSSSEAAKSAGRNGFYARYSPAAFVSRAASAPAPETGEVAVKIAKTLNELKESNALKKQDILAGSIKVVEDKTFYLVNGFWTDSTFASAKKPEPKVIEFGSDAYFTLIKDVPGISKFLSVGQQVIVEFKGTWYKIVPPARATG